MAILAAVSVPRGRSRPSVDGLSNDETDSALATLEELLTDQIFEEDIEARRVSDDCLPAFVNDFVSNARFPRESFCPIYLALLRLWQLKKRNSLSTPDGQTVGIGRGHFGLHTIGAVGDRARASGLVGRPSCSSSSSVPDGRC